MLVALLQLLTFSFGLVAFLLVVLLFWISVAAFYFLVRMFND